MVTIQKNNKCGQYSRGETDKKRATKRYSEKNRDKDRETERHTQNKRGRGRQKKMNACFESLGQGKQ